MQLNSQTIVVTMKVLSISALMLLCFYCAVVQGGPLNATREVSSAYDCKWVQKCATTTTTTMENDKPVKDPKEPCEMLLEPKYECILKPGVDISEPPCLVGYVVNDSNKCVKIIW